MKMSNFSYKYAEGDRFVPKERSAEYLSTDYIQLIAPRYGEETDSYTKEVNLKYHAYRVKKDGAVIEVSMLETYLDLYFVKVEEFFNISIFNWVSTTF